MFGFEGLRQWIKDNFARQHEVEALRSRVVVLEVKVECSQIQEAQIRAILDHFGLTLEHVDSHWEAKKK